MNRGNPLGDPAPTTVILKDGMLAVVLISNTVAGGNGGAGGNGFGFDSSNVVNAHQVQAVHHSGGAAVVMVERRCRRFSRF